MLLSDIHILQIYRRTIDSSGVELFVVSIYV